MKDRPDEEVFPVPEDEYGYQACGQRDKGNLAERVWKFVHAAAIVHAAQKIGEDVRGGVKARDEFRQQDNFCRDQHDDPRREKGQGAHDDPPVSLEYFGDLPMTVTAHDEDGQEVKCSFRGVKHHDQGKQDNDLG